jgi:hypothetical protein
MSAAQIEPPSAEVDPASAPRQAAARGLSVDPDERPVLVLSAEPPRRPVRPQLRRALVIARRTVMIIAVAIFGLIVLAFMVDSHDEPRGTPTQGVSMRG